MNICIYIYLHKTCIYTMNEKCSLYTNDSEDNIDKVTFQFLRWLSCLLEPRKNDMNFSLWIYEPNNEKLEKL